MSVNLVQGFRRQLYVQLDAGAWPKRFVSPMNALFLGLIVVNLVLLILETEPTLHDRWPGFFERSEWVLLHVFAVEYVLRIWVAGERPEFRGPFGRVRYALTMTALIDAVAILPGFLLAEAGATSALRVARLLRVLRFARFGGFGTALRLLRDVIYSRRHELLASLVLVLSFVLLSATIMYLAEGETQPQQFGSIPRSLWWSIVTMTTVGYGDAFPVTPLGKILASFVLLAGVASVAVPTGILAAAFSDLIQQRKKEAEEAAKGAKPE